MKNKIIGIFDSGVGGLTVYKEIKRLNPSVSIIYLGDTKHFPYGSKTKETIIRLSKENIDFLISKNVSEIIIACGTATSQALNEMQDIYNIPVSGIIEPAVNYIKEKGYKKVGVIATRGTIKSRSFEIEMKKVIPNIEVINKACPLLAPMAEEGWTDNEVARDTLKRYLKDFTDIQALVLGCTHYPLFEQTIKEILPKVEIINTGKIIAKNLQNRLKDNERTDKIQEDEFYLKDIESNFINVAELILQTSIVVKKVGE